VRDAGVREKDLGQRDDDSHSGFVVSAEERRSVRGDEGVAAAACQGGSLAGSSTTSGFFGRTDARAAVVGVHDGLDSAGAKSDAVSTCANKATVGVPPFAVDGIEAKTKPASVIRTSRAPNSRSSS